MKTNTYSNRSIFSTKENKHLDIGLSTTQKPLPNNMVEGTFNAYERYLTEKDSSYKYRIIASVKPVCTNVLFNNVSEIVYKEGSDDCISFNKANNALTDLPANAKKYKNVERISKDDLIRDTGYSHPDVGPIVYHCGLDIFNNHWLRKDRFVSLVKPSDTSDKYKEVFNTIKDYERDSSGNTVYEQLALGINTDKNSNQKLSTATTEMHLYQFDTIKRFDNTLNSGITENNGWFGFLNPISISTDNWPLSNGSLICINKCMLNNKGCEQMDFYPDRSLYSFMPKQNKYRNRIEKNWEIFLTYPYSSDYDNELVTYTNGDISINGLHCDILVDKTVNDDTTVTFTTKVTNSFVEGDKINIYIVGKKDGQISYEEIENVEVSSYLDYYSFQVRYMYISSTLEDFDELIEIRVTKIVNNCECKYYLRKFKKIPNFNKSNIYDDDKITTEEIDKYTKKDFNTTVSKIAFSRTIYDENVSQAIFNDDVLIGGLKDNLGRDLSEIYLTIIKTNYGHDKWYKQGIVNTEDIEYSHCFGPISSGFDLKNDTSDYNIHKIHNVDPNGIGADFVDESPKHLEENISISGGCDDYTYYGDIVEFSPNTIEETILEDVYHRFNTMQREFTTSDNENTNPYYNIKYDEIVIDDYDTGMMYNVSGINKSYTVSSYTYNVYDEGSITYAGNVNPEGYYYKPHYRIAVKEYNDTVQEGYHTKLSFTNLSTTSGSTQKILTSKNYYFNLGDLVYFYDRINEKRMYGYVVGVKDYRLIDLMMVESKDSRVAIAFDINQYFVFKPNIEMPSYAYDLMDADGRYIWREQKKTSEISNDSELYDSVFMNGAHYVYKDINFYLRRQGEDIILSSSKKANLPLNYTNTIMASKYKDVSQEEYVEEGAVQC